MGVMNELKMDSEITMESTPKKAENSCRKRKIELEPNETQGPEMNNPMNPIYKPDLVEIIALQILQITRQTNLRRKEEKLHLKKVSERNLFLKIQQTRYQN